MRLSLLTLALFAGLGAAQQVPPLPQYPTLPERVADLEQRVVRLERLAGPTAPPRPPAPTPGGFEPIFTPARRTAAAFPVGAVGTTADGTPVVYTAAGWRAAAATTPAPQRQPVAADGTPVEMTRTGLRPLRGLTAEEVRRMDPLNWFDPVTGRQTPDVRHLPATGPMIGGTASPAGQACGPNGCGVPATVARPPGRGWFRR
jgi:hypothetical protein